MARSLHNYLRWRLVQTYIDDLSYVYVHAHRIFQDNYFGYALHSSNDAYCTREIMRRFPLAMQRLYTRNFTMYPDASQTVVQCRFANHVFSCVTSLKIGVMFTSLKNAFNEYIDKQATWMADEATKTIARNKLNRLSLSIGYASIAFDDTLLDNYYAQVTTY
jgi:predicted metalloendopeptidase